MSVLTQLATALNRKDEVPNVALAEEIVKKNDARAVRELVANLSNRDRNIQSDCIKVLYEIGERDPKLIAKHWSAFGELLGSANNRLAGVPLRLWIRLPWRHQNRFSACCPRSVPRRKPGR